MSLLSRWAVALSMIVVSAPALANGQVAVPEPGTFGLLAVGVAALVASTFRKRK